MRLSDTSHRRSTSLRIKPLLKRWYYSYWPPAAGALRYFGSRIFFPPNSHVFRRVCEETVYEQDNLRTIAALLRPGTWYFDVGANLGLLSAPILLDFPKTHVVSFEPSPSALKYLRRSVAESPYRERWHLVDKALAAASGRAPFFASDESSSAYDGLAVTQRLSGPLAQLEVECSTLDAEWETLGRPAVSVIKIDVEGGELGVLQGASNCLRLHRPAILLEWNAANLRAHGVSPEAIHHWAREHDYLLFAAETGFPLPTEEALRWRMAFSENFVLLSAPGSADRTATGSAPSS